MEEHGRSRKNDDGTISFITIDPARPWFRVEVGERTGQRVLIIRDGQHEYVFNKAPDRRVWKRHKCKGRSPGAAF